MFKLTVDYMSWTLNIAHLLFVHGVPVIVCMSRTLNIAQLLFVHGVPVIMHVYEQDIEHSTDLVCAW